MSKNTTCPTKAPDDREILAVDRSSLLAFVGEVSMSPTVFAPVTLLGTIPPRVSMKATSRTEVLFDVPPRDADFFVALRTNVAEPTTFNTEGITLSR